MPFSHARWARIWTRSLTCPKLISMGRITTAALRWALFGLAMSPFAHAQGANSAQGVTDSLQPRILDTATPSEIACIGFTLDSKYFYAGSLETYMYVWETESWKRILALNPSPPPRSSPGEHQAEYRNLHACATSPDGKLLAVGSDGDSIAIYQLPSGKKLKDIPLGIEDEALAFSPDGKELAAGSGNSIAFFRLSDWYKSESPPFRTRISRLLYSPNGEVLAVDVGNIELWDATARLPRRTLNVAGNITALTFSPDGLTLAAAEWGMKENALQVWNTDSGAEKMRLNVDRDTRGLRDFVGVAFSPDGGWLISINGSGDMQELNTRDWSECQRLATGSSGSLIASTDGHWLAAGGGMPTVAIWNLPAIANGTCRSR